MTERSWVVNDDNKPYLARDVPYHKWVWWRVSIIPVVVAGLIVLFASNIFFDPADVWLKEGELDPRAKITVSLQDRLIHLPNCEIIEGIVEKMRYGIVFGKGYKLCGECLSESDEYDREWFVLRSSILLFTNTNRYVQAFNINNFSLSLMQ